MEKSQVQQVAEIRAKDTRSDAVERLRAAISHLHRCAYDLDLYAQRVESAENDLQRSLAMNWAINYLASSVMPHLRIETLARSQAELAVLAAGEAKQ